MATAPKTTRTPTAKATKGVPRKTSPSKTPTAKTAAAPKRAAAKPAEPKVVPADLRKKDLIEAVVTATGYKRGEVKVMVEAALKVLGREVAAGRGFQSPELGRLKVVKQKDTPAGPVTICRLRAPKSDDPTGR